MAILVIISRGRLIFVTSSTKIENKIVTIISRNRNFLFETLYLLMILFIDQFFFRVTCIAMIKTYDIQLK